jgi:CRP-like cAMP-binding protein
MRIVLDALRLLDEGTIEKVGNESNSLHLPIGQLSFSKDSVIKGPAIDYAYFLEEERFFDGEKIVGEGNEGNWLYVIIDGMVSISKETPNGSVSLGLLGEGSYIGTFTSFEYWKNKRLATATAVGDVCLGAIDSTALYNRFCALSHDFQKLILGLSTRMKKINDRIVAPANHYPPVDNISDKADWAFEEESLCQDVLSIIDGEAYLIGKDANTGTLLSTLEEGDMVGKLPFCYVGQEPHCATVVASKDLKTQKIDTDHIMKEFTRLPRALRNMINNVATCVARTTFSFLNVKGG